MPPVQWVASEKNGRRIDAIWLLPSYWSVARGV